MSGTSDFENSDGNFLEDKCCWIDSREGTSDDDQMPVWVLQLD